MECENIICNKLSSNVILHMLEFYDSRNEIIYDAHALLDFDSVILSWQKRLKRDAPGWLPIYLTDTYIRTVLLLLSFEFARFKFVHLKHEVFAQFEIRASIKDEKFNF